MRVHQILRQKGDNAVVTVRSGSSVAEAARLLSERRIGAVIVSDDGERPEGILSERDIVRELGRRGAECMSDKVDAMMTGKLVTCSKDDATDDILTKMTEGRFRHIPVMEDGHMIGLISIGDVVKARLSELSMERDALQDMVMGH
ncbi:CBS domain-containing protein [Roseitranquillus sediminis]|uniref:CBS domain-containing protein n=1 Tax=Roseitranquillus sediminis TaxID=2809051 RepID=UPI001D0C6701|nr:CBS domain-containing protein [Roseitranquillus sediminis]MBM9596035.1 CBS domain-containing protein [Roseitranquillus sediminis]